MQGDIEIDPASPASPKTQSTPSTRALSRKTRVYAFRDFLLETYEDYLSSAHGHVLDVAGGKGDLSWLLCNVDDVSSIVMDPRGDVSKCAIPKSVKYLQGHPEEAQRRAVPGPPTHQPLAVLMPQLAGKSDFALPRHLQICLDQELVQKIQSVVNKEDNALQEWERFWNAKINVAGRGTKTAIHLSSDSSSIVGSNNALQAILGSKLVAGFHPDQGTDYCIELAEILGIPFCIVPCCVFPSEFPHRRLPKKEEERVQSYTQLIEYLQAKCPDAKTAYLDFHFTETAKNLVLYTIPAI